MGVISNEPLVGSHSNFIQWFSHLALSGQTVTLPVWPWQQVRLTVVRTGGGASNMNIHYDVIGLLTVVWRSHSGQIVCAAWIGQGGGGFWTHSTYIRDIQESAGSRQLDRWTWVLYAFRMIWLTFGNNSLKTRWLMMDILKKIPWRGIFLLSYFYCGNLSKFESCNGDAFNVFVPKTVTSSFDMFLVSR